MTTAWDFSEGIADLVEANARSVVRIEARWNRGASGVVFADDGVIVTASHVLERDEGVNVALPDGTQAAAQVIGRDAGTDLAVLRVEATGLTAAPWTDGKEPPRVGHVVVSVGRPGRSARASLGIVGTLSNEVFRTPAGGKLDAFVQLDGGLPPGFSGSLALDAKGRALGVNTAGVVRGAAVVVPAATVKRVVTELLAHGRMRKGYMGVGMYPVRLPDALAKQVAQKTGAILVAIEPGSPADKAGLLVGDVLLTLHGKPIAQPADLAAQLEDRQGTDVTATIARGGVVQTVNLTLAQRE